MTCKRGMYQWFEETHIANIYFADWVDFTLKKETKRLYKHKRPGKLGQELYTFLADNTNDPHQSKGSVELKIS